jgi:hypothetical protein
MLEPLARGAPKVLRSPAWNKSKIAGMSFLCVRSPEAPKITNAQGGAGRNGVVATTSPSRVVTWTSSAIFKSRWREQLNFVPWRSSLDRCRTHATLLAVDAHGVAAKLVA